MSQCRIGLDRLPPALRKALGRLPSSLMLLLDNMVMRANSFEEAAAPFQSWLNQSEPLPSAAIYPTRILMQDTAGVAALVDMAALRDAVASSGIDPCSVEPAIPIDLVVDHSLQVDFTGQPDAKRLNEQLEYVRNSERYSFFKWAEQAFANLRIIPPGQGICHQINLEQLSAIAKPDGNDPAILRPEIVIGTDSHTTMINALGIMGWGVGGLEAELAASSEPLIISLPEVVEVKLIGTAAPGVTATDIALSLTRFLREVDVVGAMLEFTGQGASSLSLPARATIANMTPEYGAMTSLFAVDDETIRYLGSSGRSKEELTNYMAYSKAVGLWRTSESRSRTYSRHLQFDLSKVEPVMSGPARPQQTQKLKSVPDSIPISDSPLNGTILVAAITSCTNTANPVLMVQAGLVAKRAVELGLVPPAHVKCSLAPGSQRIAQLLEQSGLIQALEQIGFSLVGFGCTTCVGNSGPLTNAGERLQQDHPDANFTAVLSGNRNFPNRIHPHIQANYLASPPLVVAAAIAGTLAHDLSAGQIGKDKEGKAVFLADLMPVPGEAEDIVRQWENQQAFENNATKPSPRWMELAADTGKQYDWDDNSLHICKPPFYTPRGAQADWCAIENAAVLLKLGDGVTTDHISPIGRVSSGSAAATYLIENGRTPDELGTYGEYRGNHEVMLRGAFDHPAIKEQISSPGPASPEMLAQPTQSLFDTAMALQEADVPLVIIAGKNYGCGSARDWAAKATALLGVRAVIAQSFERIHRSNLIAMGVVPIVCTMPIDLEDGCSVTIRASGKSPICVVSTKTGQRREYPISLSDLSEYEIGLLSTAGIFPKVMHTVVSGAYRESTLK